MGGFPWFFIPVGLMTLNVLRKASSLWADGIGPIDAFKKGIRARLRAQRSAELPTALPGPRVDPATTLVPQDVLTGPFGDVVRRAAADREFVRELVSKLGRVEKELLPDVQPTVDALVDRIAGLAVTLHRLDADVTGTSLGQLDERIAALQRETRGSEAERRLALLQRQRSSLHDLLDRRRTLSGQLESASLALQNLKLDLLKLRSAGVDAALGDVTSATQEARALSRDIANVLEATDDVRRL
jgi:serine/threonine-protein kinase